MRHSLLPLLLLLFACSTPSDTTTDTDPNPRPTRTADGEMVVEVPNPVTLDDLLQRLPGVSVSGTRVLLRGRQPLFVLDGVPLGKDYSSVQRTVVPNDVAEVRALTNPVDTNRWGMPGANGVIVISTVR